MSARTDLLRVEPIVYNEAIDLAAAAAGEFEDGSVSRKSSRQSADKAQCARPAIDRSRWKSEVRQHLPRSAGLGSAVERSRDDC